MDEKKLNEDLIIFWDHHFQKAAHLPIDTTAFKINTVFDQMIKTLGDQCENILDIGMGSGYALLLAKLQGEKVIQTIGIDPSKHAVTQFNRRCEEADIKGCRAVHADHQWLNTLSDQTFEGILCSNVLDVVPTNVSDAIIAQITRLIKPKGFVLLKLNFLLTPALIERLKMEEIAPQTYAIEGILRGVNQTTEAWVSKFKDFQVLELAEFERLKDGPKDRLILLQKR